MGRGHHLTSIALVLGLPDGCLQNTGQFAVPVSVGRNIELFTHALSFISIISIPDKEPKYRTVRLNTGHLATLFIS